MKSKASIKKGVSLPTPPLPPTKAYRSSDYIVCIDGTLIRRPTSDSIARVTRVDPEAYKRAVENAHNQRTKEALPKWKRMAELAISGYSIKQIAEDVGFTEKSTADRLKKLREMGWNIPKLKAGRKSGEAWKGRNKQ